MKTIHLAFKADYEGHVEGALSRIGSLPFDGPVQLTKCPQSEPVVCDDVEATACAHVVTIKAESLILFPESDGEIGVVRIAEQFMNVSDEQRAAILLHELIHLRLFTGRLRRNHKAMEATRRDETEPARDCLADQLGKCVQEIACDRFAASHYPSLRAAYFDGERRLYYLDPHFYLRVWSSDAESDLHVYLRTYQLIRAEAGGSVYRHDARTLNELFDLQKRYARELRELCDDAEHARIVAAKDAIVRVEVDTNEPDDSDYMELFKSVLGKRDGQVA